MLRELQTHSGNFYLRSSMKRRVVTELLGANAFAARDGRRGREGRRVERR